MLHIQVEIAAGGGGGWPLHLLPLPRPPSFCSQLPLPFSGGFFPLLWLLGPRLPSAVPELQLHL